MNKMTEYSKAKEEELKNVREKYKGKNDSKTLESTMIVKDSNIEVL